MGTRQRTFTVGGKVATLKRNVTVLVKIKIQAADEQYMPADVSALERIESELSFGEDVWDDIVSIEYTTLPVEPEGLEA